MIKPEKRLTKDSKNKMLAGVAAGIANYFEVDPNIIRFLFIILTVFGGSGVLIYILLWLLLPNDTSKVSEGRDTFKENVQQMKETVQEFAKEVKNGVHHNTEEKKGKKSQQSLGIILVLVGLVFLLTNLGLLDLYVIQKLWPVLLIFLGILVVYQNENKE